MQLVSSESEQGTQLDPGVFRVRTRNTTSVFRVSTRDTTVIKKDTTIDFRVKTRDSKTGINRNSFNHRDESHQPPLVVSGGVGRACYCAT